MLSQFDNKCNPQIHRETTALEILEDFSHLDVFLAGVGTGGTISGVGEVLKSKMSGIEIVAVEPQASPVLSGGKAGPHKIQGIGAGFVPENLNMDIVSKIMTITNEEAFEACKLLAKKEGILVGISSGAALAASLKLAKELGRGKKILFVAPDNGERYLSMDVF